MHISCCFIYDETLLDPSIQEREKEKQHVLGNEIDTDTIANEVV